MVESQIDFIQRLSIIQTPRDKSSFLCMPKTWSCKSTSMKDKEEISTFIRLQQDNHIFIGGDFNVITTMEEKVGGIRALGPTSLDFKNWISSHNLLDIPTTNGVTT